MPLSDEERLQLLRLRKRKAEMEGAIDVQKDSGLTYNREDLQRSVAQGLKDPITGAAQLATHLLPEGVVQAGNRVNNYLADKGLPLATIPEGGLDPLIKQQEQAYQAGRQSSGMDAGRILGNIASPANLGAARLATGAKTALGRVAATSGQGAFQGAISPAEGDDYWKEKRGQVATGAAAGAALAGGGEAAGKFINPNLRPDVQTLLNEGVKLTPGQIAGGAVNRLEQGAASIPFVGDQIKSARRGATDTFNRAAINRSLAPIGEKLPPELTAGHEAIAHADQKITGAYDALLPKLTGKLDSKFSSDLSNIQSVAQGMPTEIQGQLQRIIQNEVLDRFTTSGLAQGETVKEVVSKLGGIASGLRRSTNYDERNLGAAVIELKKSLSQMLERANPQHAGELAKIDKAYSEFLRVNDAAAAPGSKEGVFNPSKLVRSVRKFDATRNKKPYGKGQAPGQEFAEAGDAVLGATVPDSGTPYRAAVGLLGAGAGAGGIAGFSAATMAPIAAAVLPYLPGGAAATRFMLSGNKLPLNKIPFAGKYLPDISKPVAEGVRKAVPYTLGGVPPAIEPPQQ